MGSQDKSPQDRLKNGLTALQKVDLDRVDKIPHDAHVEALATMVERVNEALQKAEGE